MGKLKNEYLRNCDYEIKEQDRYLPLANGMCYLLLLSLFLLLLLLLLLLVSIRLGLDIRILTSSWKSNEESITRVC
jgi:hypothetical protein